MTARRSLYLIAAASLLSLALPRLAGAEAAKALPAIIPTPAPGGTPVTFGAPANIGKPPPPDAPPDTTGVPTGAPDGPHSRTASEHSDLFVVGDYLIQPKVYDELSHGNQSTHAQYSIRAGAEFSYGSLPFMFEVETRRYAYAHAPGAIADAGGPTSSFEPGFDIIAIDDSARIGVKLLEPKVYLVVGYLIRHNDLPNAAIERGEGFGLEKLPDFQGPVSIYGSAIFYPNLVGAQTANIDGSFNPQTLHYRVLTLQLGATFSPANSPIFIDVGVLGDRTYGRDGAPSNATRLAPHVGLGFFIR